MICDKEFMVASVYKFDLTVLLGQFCSVQDSVCVSDPVQLSPPWAGGGLSHSRMRCRVPFPHVTSQLLQLPHSDHNPSTLEAKKILFGVWSRTIQW